MKDPKQLESHSTIFASTPDEAEILSAILPDVTVKVRAHYDNVSIMKETTALLLNELVEKPVSIPAE